MHLFPAPAGTEEDIGSGTWTDVTTLEYSERHELLDDLTRRFKFLVYNPEDPSYLVVIAREQELPLNDILPSPWSTPSHRNESSDSISTLNLDAVTPEADHSDAQVQTNLVASQTTEDLSLLTQDLPDDFWDDDLSQSGETQPGPRPQRGAEKSVEQRRSDIEDWIQSSLQA